MSDEPRYPRPYGAPGEPPLRNLPSAARRHRRSAREGLGARCLARGLVVPACLLGDLVFYVVLTPIWLGLRAAAWIAELRSRARR